MPRRPDTPTLKARLLAELRRRSPLSTSELADLCAADRANRQAGAFAALCQLEAAGAVRREGKAARGRGRPSVLWGLAPTCARDRKREGFRLAKRGVRMKPVIFFDMDGVVCDFVGGALALHGRTDVPVASVPWGIEAHLGLEPAEFWRHMGFAFWAGLAPLPDGFRLLDHALALVGAERIGLLTSPCDTPGCVDGKRAWVERHLPGLKRRLFVGSAKELFAGPHKVLVDDHDANVDRFAAAGGSVIQPARPWNRHKALCVRGHEFDVGAHCDMVTAAVRASERDGRAA